MGDLARFRLALAVLLLGGAGCSNTSDHADSRPCQACAGEGGAGVGARGAMVDDGGSPTAGAGMGGATTGGAPSEPGLPVRLASPGLVTDLFVSDGYVYYGDRDQDSGGQTSGHVSRVPVAGGTPTILAHAAAPEAPKAFATLSPLAIVVRGASVYWTETRVELGLPGRLAKTSTDGGDPVELWSDPNCKIVPPLAIDGDNLYWFAGCAGSSGTLMTLATTGGSARVVASGNGDDWIPAGFEYTPDTDNRALTVGNGFAYWALYQGHILSLPLSGDNDTPTRLAYARDISGPGAIVFSEGRLFFTPEDYKLQGGGLVCSFAPGDAMTTTIAAKQNIEMDSALAVDAASVYWGVSDAIKRAPRAGGPAVTVVAAVSNPRSLVVDESSLYWTDDRGGVWRVAK